MNPDLPKGIRRAQERGLGMQYTNQSDGSAEAENSKYLCFNKTELNQIKSPKINQLKISTDRVKTNLFVNVPPSPLSCKCSVVIFLIKICGIRQKED